MIPWITLIILGLLVGYVVSETLGSKLSEGFESFGTFETFETFGTILAPSDEDINWPQDMRYTGSYANVQGLGVAGDFCRAVCKSKEKDSLHIRCTLSGGRGIIQSPTIGKGFRLGRDDYWKAVTDSGKTDYCRILQDPDSEKWIATCAVAGAHGIGPREARDISPPPYIKSLLAAYQGCIAWYRWRDDSEDYTRNSVLAPEGSPKFPTDLNPIKTRGLQLNRWPQASQDAGMTASMIQDSVTWGEPETLQLSNPSKIKAVSLWVWLDTLGGRVFESSNNGSDLVFLGVDTVSTPLAPNPIHQPQALEVRPDHYLVQKKPVEPVKSLPEIEQQSSFVFEIWDKDQRIVSMRAPAQQHAWQHVVITTTDSTSWWPTWSIWINGMLVTKKIDGRSIPALILANNVIGKDMRGCIQDFRIYTRPLSPDQILETMKFSKEFLHPMP